MTQTIGKESTNPFAQIDAEIQKLEESKPTFLEAHFFPELRAAIKRYPGKFAAKQELVNQLREIDGMNDGPEKALAQNTFVKAAFDGVAHQLADGSAGAAYFLDDREVRRIRQEETLRQRTGSTRGGKENHRANITTRKRAAKFYLGVSLLTSGTAAMLLPAHIKQKAEPTTVQVLELENGGSISVHKSAPSKVLNILLDLGAILTAAGVAAYTTEKLFAAQADELALNLIEELDPKLRAKVREQNNQGRG